MVISHEASRTGAPRVAVHLIGALRSAGYRTAVVHRWGGPLEAELNAVADDSMTEPLRRVRASLRRWSRTKRLADLVERWSARRVLRSTRPDLVWCNTVVTWRYAMESAHMGIPTILYGHEQAEWSSPAVGQALRDAPRSLLLAGCSRSAADTLAELVGSNPEAIPVLHSPVDTTALGTRIRAAERSDRPTVVACGRGIDAKGFDVFLTAAAETAAKGDKARWLWVGKVPSTPIDPPPNVELIGEVSDPTPYLAAADIVTCPSRADSFPLVVLEAMALGRPIVASDLPGIREQLGMTGVLVRPGDAQILATEVRNLLADPKHAADLGRAAGERCRDRWDVRRFERRVAEMSTDALTTTPQAPPLRVVHIMGRLSPGGGVQIVVRRLAENADPRAIDLHVVTMRPPWDDLSDVPVTLHPLGFRGQGFTAVDRLRIMWKAAREIRHLDPDVVQLHSGTVWMGALARAMAPRTPFVLEVHDAPGSGRHGVWTDRFEGWCLRRFGMTAICHSREVEQALIEVSSVPSRRIRRFPLGIDTSVFLPVDRMTRKAVRRSLGLTDSTVVAIAIGRAAASKRFDLAIESVSIARSEGANISLVVVGVGDDADLIAQRDRLRMGELVHLLDGRFGTDLAHLIAASDILLSTSDYEGFGLTLVEGMSCGLPVIAAGVGGVTDIVVNGETGFLVPPGDGGAVSRRLVTLAHDPALRRRLGDNARGRATERFDAATTAEAFTNAYRSLARRSVE